MIQKTISDLLREVEESKGKRRKIEKLHEHSCVPLKNLLNYTFNPKIKWLLPEGDPPYTPCKEAPQSLVSRLYQESSKMGRFLSIGEYPNLAPAKRQSLFIDMIESIHPDDAALMLQIKDKKLPFKSITPELIKEAFPLFTQDW